MKKKKNFKNLCKEIDKNFRKNKDRNEVTVAKAYIKKYVGCDKDLLSKIKAEALAFDEDCGIPKKLSMIALAISLISICMTFVYQYVQSLSEDEFQIGLFLNIYAPMVKTYLFIIVLMTVVYLAPVFLKTKLVKWRKYILIVIDNM